MTAVEGPGISYTWRSILHGFKALEKGLIWRVGDGTQVRIWEDPWIPCSVTRRPITPRGNVLLSKVSELIDPATGGWDAQLVRDIFWDEDVTNILATPTRMGRNDVIAWHFDTKGRFSVKSAYHVLEDGEERHHPHQRGECSSGGASISDNSKWWKRIWKLQCSQKIKQFIWRLAHNSLPLKMNIKQKGIDLDTRCPV